MKWGAVAFALLPLAPALAGPQAAGPQTSARPQFTTRTDLVTVDVAVFDQQSRPVEGLSSSDFTVLVEGTPRRIAAISFFGTTSATSGMVTGRGVDQSPVDAARAEAAARADAPELARSVAVRRADRRFVIVIDRDHIRAGEGQQTLAAAARFIKALPVSDRVAVWTLPGHSGKPSFDESRESVVRKVRNAIGVYRPLSDPASPGFWEFNLLDRRQGALEFIRGVRDLLFALQPIEGPKHVVIVSSGGWMDTTNLGLIREAATLATSSRTQIHAMHVRPLPGAAARADVRDMPSECRDERVLSTGGAAYELSLLTGGLADQPTEGLIEGAAFDRLARQLSQWYLLGFEPADSDHDGRPHRIEVQLTTRPDVTVRAGRMFYQEAAAVTARKTAKPPPPPALEWNDEAERRTRLGLPPFAWMPEWLDTAQRFCRKPELGADVEAVCNWDAGRLQSMTSWLAWLSRNEDAPPVFAAKTMRAAALLHTAAFICQVRKDDRTVSTAHLGLASMLLDRFDGPTPEGPSLLQSWYAVTPQWLSAHVRFADALMLLEGGLTRFPNDPGLHALAGTLHETIASPLVDPYLFSVFERNKRAQQVRSSLDEAARAYRRALDLAPGLVEARLHLGRVLDRLGRPDEAKAEFERVIATGAEGDTAWLAHMFVGRAHEQAGRYPEAVTAYRRAFGIRSTQSATVALAHVLDRSGEREAALTLLGLLTGAGEVSPECDSGCDPWLKYNLVKRRQVGDLIEVLLRRACL